MGEPPIAQECVEGYLFASTPLRLLILRRPPSRERIWVPVSGKVEPTDRDFPSALRRELLEETGFSSFRRLFDMDWQVVFERSPGVHWRLHGFGVELDHPLPPRLSDEHEAFAWVSVREALERLHYSDNREAVLRLLGRVAPERVPAGKA
ncbi:MAG TPA: NUDIX domain-containing protein [Thermoplasmata archaeon]|nr:NUDIX domain-containing protein [Thermoplasmata archaeon]